MAPPSGALHQVGVDLGWIRVGRDNTDPGPLDLGAKCVGFRWFRDIQRAKCAGFGTYRGAQFVGFRGGTYRWTEDPTGSLRYPRGEMCWFTWITGTVDHGYYRWIVDPGGS